LDEPLQPGSQISVPGEFRYIYRKNGPSYLRVWQYVDESPPPTFDPNSLVLRREQVQRGEDLEAFLGKHQLAADFVCRMNGLSRDEPLEEGRWLLVEYSVEVNQGATLEDIAQHFELPVERLLEVNQLEIGQDEFERGRRIQIPIGDRMRDVQPVPDRVLPNSKMKVFEVELQPDVSRSPR
jgi:hypothetical protein